MFSVGLCMFIFPSTAWRAVRMGKLCASVQFLSEGERRFYSETFCCPADVENGG